MTICQPVPVPLFPFALRKFVFVSKKQKIQEYVTEKWGVFNGLTGIFLIVT